MTPLQQAHLLIQSYFENFEGRCAFQLLDGTCLEGYCLELEDDFLRFGSGGPLADGQDLLIPLAQIRLDSFSALESQSRRYREACWNPLALCWNWI